jgi:hypothetical protein
MIQHPLVLVLFTSQLSIRVKTNEHKNTPPGCKGVTVASEAKTEETELADISGVIDIVLVAKVVCVVKEASLCAIAIFNPRKCNSRTFPQKESECAFMFNIYVL